MNQDLGTPTKQLADGFSALCEEYKLLAQQYTILENKLAVATSECEALRRLLPSNSAPSKTYIEECGEPNLHPGRNLGEWLAQMYEKGGGRDKQPLTIISDAEFACFKIRNNLSGDRRIGPRSGRASPGGSRPPPRSGSVQLSRPLSPIPMEQDFTVEKEKGELRCPFADLRGRKPADHPGSISQSRNIPTPRGSGSHLTVNGLRSKRASFVDPIKPQVIKIEDPPSPAESDTSGGPACPIRFLGQHSPEEVAKYFEEHKHELPRSHEVCVKRFQTNTDSIRELDAKYGNLVTMIQGLGQKHQPMLPEVPNIEDGGVASDEHRSNRRVKKWATAVSECAPIDATGIDPDEDQNPSIVVDDGEDEERIQRFDRDLQEVRLGESPSRPWGVTIPSKFPNRRGGSTVCSSSAAAAPVISAPVKSRIDARDEDVESHQQPQDDVPTGLHTGSATNKTKLNSKPSGKCPFDHAAMRKPPAATAIPEPPTATQPPSAKSSSSSSSAKPSKSSKSWRPRENKLINYGVAFVAEPDQIPYVDFVNRGTLILGYKEEEVGRLLRGLRGGGG